MSERIEEIGQRIEDHERRIAELEKAIFVAKIKPKVEQEFKGLRGGIDFLISKGFLATPKLAKEIRDELAREGYHYGLQSVDKLLRIDFVTKKKILTRIREGKVWKYVLRK